MTVKAILIIFIYSFDNGSGATQLQVPMKSMEECIAVLEHTIADVATCSHSVVNGEAV